MTSPPDRNAGAIRLAIAVSGLLIGFQVAGRATRDALYLSQFPVTTLPRMVATAAIISLIAAVAMSRVMGRIGPGRLVPLMLATSATLQLVEFALYHVAPGAAAVMVFIQFNAIGALLVSGFWSLINERFDPRAAKRAFGLIGTAGTVGGVLGGLMAERAGALFTVADMLPALALIHFACAGLVIRIRAVPPREGARAPAPVATVAPAGFRALAQSPYLRLLAAALILGTVSEGLLDYVFKDAAKHTYGRGPELLRFFALFYAAINVAGGVIGAAAGRRALERFGIARTVSALPWGVAAGGSLAIAFPGLGSVVFARGAEATMRNSLYRSGFELLFTPLPPEEKRAAKPLLDVGAVRAGDMLAAGFVQLALLAWPARSPMLMLVMAVLAAAVGIVLTFRIHKGYVTALEHSLLARAFQLEMGDAVLDRTTRMTMARATPIMPQHRQSSGAWSPDIPEEEPAPAPADPALVRLAELHLGDWRRVQYALGEGPLAPLHVPRAIELLGRDDVSMAAHEALTAVAARHAGQMVDALLDPTTDPAVRRRLPAVIAAAKSPRALDGLLTGLHDERFEVRARCGRALVRLLADAPMPIDPARVLTAVLKEVDVDRHVWESQRLLGDDADDPLQIGDAVRERASRSLEHVFAVLSLVLPRQPLQIAFQGLHTDDPHLRGTALEYLETALPPAVREKLWPFIGDRPMRPAAERPREQVVAELMASRSSIMMNLEDVNKLG